MDCQPAVPDNVSRTLPNYRQKPRSPRLGLRAYLLSDVFHGWSAVGVDPPMRRYSWIPVSPQLPKGGGVVHSARPQDQPFGLQRSQNTRSLHAGIISGRSEPPERAIYAQHTGPPALGWMDRIRCRSDATVSW